MQTPFLNIPDIADFITLLISFLSFFLAYSHLPSPLDGHVSQSPVHRRGRSSMLHGGQLPTSSASERPCGPCLLQINPSSSKFSHQFPYTCIWPFDLSFALKMNRPCLLFFDIDYWMYVLLFIYKWISDIHPSGTNQSSMWVVVLSSKLIL